MTQGEVAKGVSVCLCICTSSITDILFIYSLTPFQKDSLIEPLLMLKGTMKDQEAKDQVGHSLPCLTLTTKWEQWEAQQNAYLRISTQYSAWSKTLYTYFLFFLLSSNNLLYCKNTILPTKCMSRIYKHVTLELPRDGYSWEPMSPQQMATLIDHITRMDAQIEGRGFFILNKEMATTVRPQILQKSMLWCTYQYNHHLIIINDSVPCNNIVESQYAMWPFK